VPAETSPGVPTPSVQAHDERTSRNDALVDTPLTWRRAQCATNSCVEVARLPDGGAAIRDSKSGDTGPVLRFRGDEWNAFVTGVKTGEFG
jgi:hypothetical protein